MRVALCQLDIAWEDKKMNLEQVKVYIQEAKAERADMIFFPEMSLTGFSMNTAITKEKDGETVKEMQRLSAANQIAVGIGWVNAQMKDGRETIKNCYTVIDSRGEILSYYAKIHPFGYVKENKYFDSGSELAFFEYQGRKFSTFICYDLRFPEIFEIASRRAEILVVPANWPQHRKEHWITLLRARAIENQVYMFGINCVGDKDGLYYSGDSCIIDPNGNIMEILSDKEGLIVLDIPDNIAEIREGFPVRRDRKPELYKKLSQEV